MYLGPETACEQEASLEGLLGHGLELGGGGLCIEKGKLSLAERC